ncbi:MAG TPA: DUF4149 domain-containing protein [Thermomicrobiales bacterium]|nr:DUF4149 domain-containing protein [Thermomicrobiales bacterium]
MRAVGRTLTNFALLFALTVWGGAVFFFAILTTPVIFADLDRDSAARLLGDLFPRYYQVALVCSAVALVVIVGRLLWGAPPRRLAVAAALLLAVALAITCYSTFSLLPRMQGAQARVPSFVTMPASAPERVAYGQLHGQSMLLTGLAALLGGAALVLIAAEPRLLVRPAERVPTPANQPAPAAARQAIARD